MRAGQMSSLGGSWRYARAAAALAWAWACAPRAGADASVTPVERKPFGGERAAFGESDAVTGVTVDVGRCQNVPALGSDPLLSDFEQDAPFLRPIPERWGVWFMANDGSPDGRQVPESYAAERGGYAGSNYAVHFQVDGFTDWGATLGFLIRYAPSDGIRCPFNAAAFDGLAFVARGKGRIRVTLGTPETTPPEHDGRCQSGCWDTHGSFVFLTEEWQEHRIAWSAFAQQGWGRASRLDVKELLAVNFSVGRGDQPAELWLDDVRFLPSAAAHPAAGNRLRPAPAAPSARRDAQAATRSTGGAGAT